MGFLNKLTGKHFCLKTMTRNITQRKNTCWLLAVAAKNIFSQINIAGDTPFIFI